MLTEQNETLKKYRLMINFAECQQGKHSECKTVDESTSGLLIARCVCGCHKFKKAQ